MKHNGDSTTRLSDSNVVELLKIATDPPKVLEELESLTELTPKELWEEIIRRWKYQGQKWSRAVTAQLLGVPDYRLDRWRRHRELAQPVRQRIAALCELLALLACGKLNAVKDQDLRSTVTILRGLTDDADNSTVNEVLALLESEFGKSTQTHII